MKMSSFNMSVVTSVCAVVLMALSCLPTATPAMQKMKPEELVAKHLEAIGAAQARSPAISRVMTGNSKFSYRTRSRGSAEGNAVIASQDGKFLIGMAFPTDVYPHERIGFDGQTITTGFINPNERTTLGNFLLTQNVGVKEGLMGGVLSTGWPLLDLSAKNPKLDYSGIKKINGKEMHQLRYRPKKGSEFDIKLYFDAATFQHLRTEYERVVSSRMGSNPDASSSQIQNRYKMVEEFSDFKEEGGLTLPHSYTLQLMIEGQGTTSQFEWAMALTVFQFKQPIPEGSFNVENFKLDK
jgi:hypothetical protein